MGWSETIYRGDRNEIKQLVEGTKPQSWSLYINTAIEVNLISTALYLNSLGCVCVPNEFYKARYEAFFNCLRKEKIKLLDKQLNQV